MLTSVPYPLISDESTCCGCSEVGNVSPNGVETVGEVTSSFGTCGDVEGCGRCWEVQDGDTGTVSVRGRLSSCVTFWEQKLHAPPWVLDTVRNGYVLPFYLLSTPYSRPNQHTARIEREFVDKAVYELLKGGYIERAESPPVV